MEKLTEVKVFRKDLYCDKCNTKMVGRPEVLTTNYSQNTFIFFCPKCGKSIETKMWYPDYIYEDVRPTIKLSDIVKLQHKLIELFTEQDDDFEYVDWHKVKCIERRITVYLNRMSDNKELQHKIRKIIETENWNTSDLTYKPICDKIRELGFEIKEGE